MRHPSIERLLEAQQGLFAAWQCDPGEVSHHAIAHAATGLRRVHDGVYVSGHAPLTRWQTFKAATLTTPSTFLADWSAASFHGMRDQRDRGPTTVLRPGSGGVEIIEPGPGRLGSLSIRRSEGLRSGTTVANGIACTTVPKTLLRLMSQMGDERAARMVREVLRLELASVADLRAQLLLGKGARGVARLRLLVDEYAGLPAARTRSDAEILAVAILKAAGVEAPAVNVVVAGGEGDLVFWARRLIVELDGPQYHRFPQFDAVKQRRWEAAGWTVRRLPTDDVYRHPHRLIAAATDPIVEPSRRASNHHGVHR